MPWANEIQSIYLDKSEKAIVILRNAEVSARNQRCIKEIRLYCERKNFLPVILTRGLFVYMLRYLDPYEYSHIVKSAALVFGTDILAGVPPPDQSFMVHNLIEKTPLLLTFPQSRNFILPGRARTILRREFRYKLERALALKLLLERGTIERVFSSMLGKYHDTYPRQGLELRDLENSYERHGHDEWSRKSFMLLRDITDDIHHGLSVTGILENTAGAGRSDGSAYFELLATSLRDCVSLRERSIS